MNHRRLVALALLVACTFGAGAALAAPDRPLPAVPKTSSSATDAAVVTWLRQLDRTHNNVPAGHGLRPAPYVPDQGGYSYMIDDFEQGTRDFDFYKGWVLVEDLNGPLYGDYYWGVSDCQAKSGTRSGWAIGNGEQGALLDCGAYYPHGVNSSALLRLDLTGFPQDIGSLELVFDFWLNLRTEVEGGVVPDGLFVLYHLPTSVGELPFERVVVAKLTGQQPDRFWSYPWRVPLNAATDLNDPQRVFNLAGLPDVDIEFLMVTKQTDGTTYPEGVFIDNVRLEASEAPITPSPGTPRPTKTPSPTTPVPTTAVPTTPSAETPTTETPTSETPTSETPTSETPTSETPTSETPTSGTPGTPTSETPTSETPTSETPTSETPTLPSESPTWTPSPETATPTPEGYRIFLPVALNESLLVPAGPTPTAVTTPEETLPVPSATAEMPTEEPTEEATETPVPLQVEFDLLEVGGSGVTGHVMMTEGPEGMEVQITVEGTEPGSEQPASIQLGTCGMSGGTVLALEPVIDGQSDSFFEDEVLADYADGGHSLRVMLSDTDATVLVCGDIPSLMP
jgi:hypothetical protein